MFETSSTSTGRGRPTWLVPVIVVAAVLLLLVLPLVSSYNGMVDKRNAVDNSFADLDAQLQRRNDLIPNLVNAVRGAIQHEEAVFKELADARASYGSATSSQQKADASAKIDAGLGRLIAIVESNPQLQANQNIRDLQTQLEGTENRVAQARRDYNGVTTTYNRSIQHFPRNIVAGIFGFSSKPLFKATAGASTPPTVDLNPATTTTAAR